MEENTEQESNKKISVTHVNSDGTVFENLKNSFIHPSAYVHPTASVGDDDGGAVVGEFAWVGAQAKISSGAQLCRLTVVGEKAKIGALVSIGDSSVISGGVKIGPATKIGKGVWIGSNVTVLEGTKILDNVRVPKGTYICPKID